MHLSDLASLCVSSLAFSQILVADVALIFLPASESNMQRQLILGHISLASWHFQTFNSNTAEHEPAIHIPLYPRMLMFITIATEIAI